MPKVPSTTTWITVHLVYPLLPFVAEGLIRWAIIEELSLRTFSASTLAISSGLLAILVNQSLRTHQAPLPGDDEEAESLAGAATAFIIFAILSFVLFGLLVSFGALVHDRGKTDLAGTLRVFQLVCYVGAVIPTVAAIVAQRSFKLRATLL